MTDPIVLLTELVQTVLNRLEVLVGGVFGLYIIFFVYKMYEIKKQNEVLENIKKDLSYLKRKIKSS
tara:strand:- start:460 stop:657 length:198 start_codon:yes stop_codon:yes gene_type:complete